MNMSNRPTPETDDQPTINAINDDGYAVPCVDIEFARKLERERDEARKELKHITEYGTEEINAAVELRQKLASALVERDEAREELRTAVQERHDFHWELLDAVREKNEARDRMADALQEVDLRTLDYERMKQERDEAREQVDCLREKHDLTPMCWNV